MSSSRERSYAQGPVDRQILWEEVDLYCRRIAAFARREFPNTQIIAGIKSGGCIPAAIIAYYMGCRSMEINATGVGFKMNPLTPGVLVVDDVYDTGETFKSLYEMYKTPFRSAVLVSRPQTPCGCESPGVFPNYSAERISEWVVFPWEK